MIVKMLQQPENRRRKRKKHSTVNTVTKDLDEKRISKQR